MSTKVFRQKLLVLKRSSFWFWGFQQTTSGSAPVFVVGGYTCKIRLHTETAHFQLYLNPGGHFPIKVTGVLVVPL